MTMEGEQIVENLLLPRIKVNKDYPFNEHFKVGQILTFFKAQQHGQEPEYFYHFPNNQGGTNFEISFFRNYPHLFTELKWYEEREASELPKFIGSHDGNNFRWVAPIVKWCINQRETYDHCVISFTNLEGNYDEIEQSLYGARPATETDFQNYIKAKQ